MKKTIMILAISAMSVFGLGLNAQTQSGNSNCEPASKECRLKSCPDAYLRQFKGINLTDAQKNQLKSLSDKMVTERKALRKDVAGEKRIIDSTFVVRQREEKAKYLKSVKSILTPDQYLQFLENSYLNGGQRGPKIDKIRRDGKDFKKGFKKGDKGREGGIEGRRDGKKSK